MKILRLLIPGAALALSLAAGGRADVENNAQVAFDHLSAVVLIQRWSQAIFHILPLGGTTTPPTVIPFKQTGEQNGVPVFTEVLFVPHVYRVVITNYGGSASDFDQLTTLANGYREKMTSRTVEQFNGGPGKVHFVHTFSVGGKAEYDEELQQEAAGPGLNFLYGLITTGSFVLPSGQALDFTLRQTQSFDCFDFFTGNDLPEDICSQWFDFDPTLNAEVPKPDHLEVTFRGTASGSMTLDMPVADPTANVPDFSKPTTGLLSIDGRVMHVTLTTDKPDVPGWRFWDTAGPGYDGHFRLLKGYAGFGQAFAAAGARAPGKGGSKKLAFAARWNKDAIGTVVLPDGQTRPGGPTTGALDFGLSKWSGIAAAFGPAPGL